jgi:hypothetical protein
LRVFENRVLRVFESKREEVAGGWRKLHSELYNLCSLPNIIRMMRWVWYVAHMSEMRNAYAVLITKPEGKRPRPRHR